MHDMLGAFSCTEESNSTTTNVVTTCYIHTTNASAAQAKTSNINNSVKTKIINVI